MTLPFVLIGCIFLILLALAILLIRYFCIWHADMQCTAIRLTQIEHEVKQLPEQCPVKQQWKNETTPKPLAPEEKPKDLVEVRKYIRENYPNLIENIAHESARHISPTDEILCMTIAMEYTNKEIATLLCITNPSVLSARYRLKRKIGLVPKEQLDTWIRQRKL